MKRILVVAHRTLGGEHLLDEVRSRMAEGDVAVHLLVPVEHPRDSHSWTEHEIEAAARAVLDEGMAKFRALDATGAIDVTGEVGDANPVYAVTTLLHRGDHFDEVVLSTLPAGPSRWLRADVPSRLARELRIPITHVVAQREPAH